MTRCGREDRAETAITQFKEGLSGTKGEVMGRLIAPYHHDSNSVIQNNGGTPWRNQSPEGLAEALATLQAIDIHW